MILADDVTDWTHFVVTCEGDVRKMYVDGIEQTSATTDNAGNLDDGFTHDTSDNDMLFFSNADRGER